MSCFPVLIKSSSGWCDNGVNLHLSTYCTEIHRPLEFYDLRAQYVLEPIRLGVFLTIKRSIVHVEIHYRPTARQLLAIIISLGRRLKLGMEAIPKVAYHGERQR